MDKRQEGLIATLYDIRTGMGWIIVFIFAQMIFFAIRSTARAPQFLTNRWALVFALVCFVVWAAAKTTCQKWALPSQPPLWYNRDCCRAQIEMQKRERGWVDEG